MRFLRAVCGRRAALCGEKKGCTPTRDAASRAVAPLPLQSAATACALRESGPPARFPGFGAPNVSQNHALCMASKRVGFANTQKRPHPGAGCGLPGCRPPSSAIRSGGFAGTLSGIRRAECLSKPCALHGFQARRLCQHAKKGRTPARDAASRAVAPLPLQSAAAALPARFPGFGAPNVSQNHAPCTVSKRVGFAKRKKGRTPTRDAASGLSFRRWRCFGCGSCGRRCRRGRPAPRACRTRRCARPG